MGLSKLVDKLKKHSISGLQADSAVSGTPSKKQIYQARYNFGVNFGGCFVGEKWIFHSIFPDGTDCELDAVAKSVKENGTDGARKRLEEHWSSYATDDDWSWLQNNGVTSVRIPIGYWDIDGGKFTKGTKFAKYKEVYSGAWNIFKKKFVEPAGAHNIAVLVDLHGLPGGANGADHSGEKSGGKAEFWGNSSYQALVTDALQFVARDLKGYDNIAAIQVVNEAEFSESGSKQKSYYLAAIKAIRQEDKTVPIVISDGWWPDQFAKWVQENEGLGVVIDHHCYRCFDDKDKSKNAEQIIQDLDGDLLTNISNNGNGVDFMVGEYSVVLDGNTWKNSGLDPNDGGNSKRAELTSAYGKKQLSLMFQRSGCGAFFWTYKFESGNGGEWDFRQQLGKGLSAPKVEVKGSVDQALEPLYNSHVSYWNGQNPREKYDHERYKDGFKAAWNDALAFAKEGSIVGRRQAVKAARLAEHLRNKGSLNFIWEWEQGYDKGIEEYYK